MVHSNTSEKSKRDLIVYIGKTLLLVSFFYIFSISLTFYNKKYIVIFPYPLSITILHLLTKFLLAWLLRSIYENIYSCQRVQLEWKQYVKNVAPAGLTSALDIGISNWSFEFITISLYTMTKSSSIIFILLFAIILRLEHLRWSLVAVISLIACGLFMFTYKSTQFNFEGFLLVLLASFISGIRWTLTQSLTQRQALGLSNPVDMMFHIQPWMILCLLPLSVPFEAVNLASTSQFFRYESFSLLANNVLVLFMGAILAFFLECSEYLLIGHTSSLALSVAGILKEICTLLLAAVINGDEFNMVNGVGLVLSMAGICLHVYQKAQEKAHSFSLPASSSLNSATSPGASSKPDSRGGTFLASCLSCFFCAPVQETRRPPTSEYELVPNEEDDFRNASGRCIASHQDKSHL